MTSATFHGPSNSTTSNGIVAQLAGTLIPLKTTLETSKDVKLLNVFITAVPLKKASGTLSLIRQLIPRDGGYDLQHLRRFAKPDLIPSAIRNSYFASSAESSDTELIFLIVAVASIIPKDILLDSLQKDRVEGPVVLVEGQIPFNAPTSAEQAKAWTNEYWPTVYKKSNPFGPHPAIVARAQAEIEGNAGKWLSLAWTVAAEAKTARTGEGVGVVIVERSEQGERCLAVAGDARWDNWPRDCGGNGNVTAHAAMRAIAMVTAKLPNAIPVTETDIFRSQPLFSLETDVEEPVNKDGYLCHELEIYCTHEPCVMCAMAIVHSRFGKIVFEKRMDEGGITADLNDKNDGLGHGLWWRRELNWTMLGWEFRRKGDGNDGNECRLPWDVDNGLNA
ncbi:Cytidine deaminase-like protein [Glarea lozoyensis ATCC 20868]|uniref:Cytidine deaminase-like protein n=1 Tax=Glarea lozoyensis (strain ATCC 20868 / MF5171) TaxID=1116229 RepID=S3CZ61_GLAL2|nr:Cytidine deaminase-like protein [Glarea lozoyensis ATCC 20868]EPE30875.1 Cytidine deaminase-like protein [Glarea lozoyensis ATCC 20868]